ncbi:MAG: hypothetical protein KDK63_03075, partial [Chlamydiia bacterium]|nr:hypothetical protein [Chlamydiia bacterium]
PSPADYALLKDHQARTQNLITLKEQVLESEKKKLKDCNDAVSASGCKLSEKTANYSKLKKEKKVKKETKHNAKKSLEGAVTHHNTQVDIKNKQDGVVNGIQQELNALAQESQEYQEALAQMDASLDDAIAAVPTEKTLELIEKTLRAEKALSKSPNDIHAQNVASLQKQSQTIRTQLSLPPPPPLSITASLNTSVKKIHGIHSKEHLVHLKGDYGEQKQIGKFSSKADAEFFQSKYRAYLARLNEQNQEVAHTHAHYSHLEMDLTDITSLPYFEPIFVEISACGSNSNVYKGDKKDFSNWSHEKAIQHAAKIMDDHIESNDQAIHAFKTKMSDKIFSDPSTSSPAKVVEMQRIVADQQKEIEAQKHLDQQRVDIRNGLKAAKKVDNRKAKEEQNERLLYERKIGDEKSFKSTERVADNNCSLQIAEGNTTRAEVNQIKQDRNEKKGEAQSVANNLQEARQEYKKNKSDKKHDEVKKTTKTTNRLIDESNRAENRYREIQGLEIAPVAPSNIKVPPKPTAMQKTRAWINNNVSGSGEVNIVTVSGPNTPTAPSLIHIKVDSKKPNLTKRTTHSAPEPVTAPSSRSESASLPQEETQTTTTTTTTTHTPSEIANLEFYDPFYVPPPLQAPSFHPEKTLSSITEPTAEKYLHDTPQTKEPFITKENLKVAIKDSLKPGPSNFLSSIITQKVQQSVNKYAADLANQGKSDSGVHEIGTRQLSKGLIMSIGGINTDLKEHMQTANQISAAANGAKVTIVY